MATTPSDCITERHLTLFGTIVRWFAQYEVLIQQVIATVIGSHLADVMLLTKTLTTGEKAHCVAWPAAPPENTPSIDLMPVNKHPESF